MDSVIEPLLGPADLARLRTALDDFTVDAVSQTLGPVGDAALGRGDRAGVARQLDTAVDARLAALLRLFLLGAEVEEKDARRALHPLDLAAADAAGLVGVSAGACRALLDVRPYAEASDSGPGWWVVSDFGSDVRTGKLAADHVLGIGAAALTLAQATPRDQVRHALDVGTGCGVQALHLGQHAARVTATDISRRALRLAATTAALSDQSWDLRAGSLLAPVDGELFDLVVANPPFVVSPGAAEHEYRDSGLPGDEVCRRLVSGLPGILAAGGTAQLLANWIIPADGDWQERVSGWLTGSGCDAWVWQREIADPSEYVAMWLRDAGLHPHAPGWNRRYDDWLDWFAAHGVAGVGMGMVTLWRRPDGDPPSPVLVLEDVRQAVQQPVGQHLPDWVARQRWLAARSDAQLLAESLSVAPDVVRTRQDLLGDDGWTTARATLRQSHGMRWEVEVDDAVAAFVAACGASAPTHLIVDVLAASLDADRTSVAAGLGPVVRDLVARGFLLPPESTCRVTA
ncbi:MAG: methyltransferase [Jatrophihabitans sp.]